MLLMNYNERKGNERGMEMAQYLGETKTWMGTGLHSALRYTEYSNEQLFNPHCNNCYEILFVLKGSVRFDLEGERIVVKENNAIVIAPMVYQIVSGNDDTYHRIILFFDLPTVPDAIRDDFARRVGKRYIFSAPEMTQLFHKFRDTMEKEDGRYDALKEALFTMITYNIAMDESIGKNASISGKSKKLRQIIDYLDKHITTEVRICTIAQELNMSQSAVYRMFKEEMQISLKQYILQKKMIYAETLLRQGVSPGDAALACGYRNYASFYKVFVKLTGKIPGRVL